MKNDIVEFCIAETEHPTNAAQTTSETISSPPRGSRGGYAHSRFNAVRHAVLSAHTVLPWEDKAEYQSLLGALAQEYTPDGPTEDHLVEEIAGIIWRKRRLRLAEAPSYRRGLKGTTEPYSGTLSRALIEVEYTGSRSPIIEAVTATPSKTAKDLVALEKRKASAQTALEILSAGKADAYKAALAELDQETWNSWQEQVAPAPEDPDEDDDPDEDEDADGDDEPYTADATGLAQYLEHSVLPLCAKQLENLENRPLIREQVLGETFDVESLERLSRYEVHLDRKLERTLTMLLRLQALRRSKESD
jgi:hypothetical protein